MKKIFVSLIALISLNAFSATQNITVNGTVSSQCQFNSVTNGVFGYDVTAPNVLDTASVGGNPASVVINYNGTPTISIGEITSFSSAPSGFSDTVAFLNVASTTNLGSLSYSGNVASGTETGGVVDTLNLRVRANNNTGSFPIGNYVAGTTITCQ